MMKRFRYVSAAVFAAMMAGSGIARADANSTDEGLRVFKAANCVGCHKWTGAGGGGYGGAAANLRKTKLTLEQIELTIRCGRISKGMPHFDPDAYTDGRCYGMKASQLEPGRIPPEADHPLRQADIDAVAKYVVANIKGQGEATLDQCHSFFGAGSRVCDMYAKQDEGGTQHASAEQQETAETHHHMKVEAATDSNAPHQDAEK
nr:c-type cytochrome [uncultured Rhodopila sp.]